MEFPREDSYIPKIRDYSDFFANPRTTKDEVVGIGGDLSIDRLLYAYTHGIFPWADKPLLWFSLDPRAIFDLNVLHLSSRVHRKIRQKKYTITINRAFEQVMRCCSYRPEEQTWITDTFLNGFARFHREGYAHSLEVWSEDGRLGGGIYGVAIGKFFAGESMFSFESDFGKIGLYHLFQLLKKDGFILFDTQQMNPVTLNLGAYEIPKSKFLDRLTDAVETPSKWRPSRLEN
ncbi:leucyltransferase [Leptospira inadai serovar Lyme str. 10]|uniref:Leucyl/phenylalanyl-tRNA--protein transferase n=2 Tax=Leptospira inadai serovar Lyme TaxID=293084 RepID=V6H9L5_9LEPT|nr:leucyltransferase [Leptospira inadai serovar Lyme str. 10]PNV75436.1 leucyl/phenylalanyl-tRNA--protein transferase [Leptospira inadai serovar Lyme]